MTAVWGPLGWVTLHSVATSYSEVPTNSEKQLVSSWLDLFAETITCSHCKEHFTEMLATYRVQYPNYLDSRHNLAMFSFRAHNAVNRRLSKPVYSSVEECMASLQNIVKQKPAQHYRVAYVNHITRYWRTLQDITGIVALKKIVEMKKIETEYFAGKDTNFNITLRSDVVVLPRDALEKQSGEVRQATFARPTLRSAMVLGPGGFRIRR